jgi:hypothetical protein
MCLILEKVIFGEDYYNNGVTQMISSCTRASSTAIRVIAEVPSIYVRFTSPHVV